MVQLDSLVFVALNSRVAALDRDTGELVWEWRHPRSRIASAYTTASLDGDRLIVSVNGYLYCLDARTGGLKWENELKGYGIGVATVVSTRSPSGSGGAARHAAAASSS